MSITLAGYGFSGPFKSTSSLADKSGLYAILTPITASQYKVVDVGESATVKSRVENHDRKACWQSNTNSRGLCYAAHYTPALHQAGRKAIEQRIRQHYDPPCGSQ